MAAAGESAYKHMAGEYLFSGEKQLVVSKNKNVILLILDRFPSTEFAEMLEVYPDAADFLHDFTYYDNADCSYFSTYPSLAHMLTGYDFDMTMLVNEWCTHAWENERTVNFYNDLHKNNYEVNAYLPYIINICGSCDYGILEEKFDNLVQTTDPENVDVFYKLLWKTITKMSAYRMAPEILKPAFYTNQSEYGNIIEYEEISLLHDNFDFYAGLLDEGLTLDKSDSDFYIVQHLLGLHDNTTAANGFHAAETVSTAETAKGCLVVVEEYLNQLKELGVYDDAAIIITSDHGSAEAPQVIFYVKEPQETHEVSPVNGAPISHKELLPTLAKLAGLPYTEYGSGNTIYDFSEGELRERYFWRRDQDPNLPFVPIHSGERDGYNNVFYGYHYIGGLKELLETIEDGPDDEVAVPDSYF